jgi:hypothetical protein
MTQFAEVDIPQKIRGRILITPSQLANPGVNKFDKLTDFVVSVIGATSGNGTFSRTDFDAIQLNIGSPGLDFSTDLVGQATNDGPWGTPVLSATFPDVYVLGGNANANAPTRSGWSFQLMTAGGEVMQLTSFRPASGPPPAGSVVHPSDLAAAFTNRSTLVDAPGEVVPSNVTSASNGGTTIWQWTPQVDGWFDINTFGSSFDTRLSVYEGTVVDSLTWIAGNDDAYPGEFAADHPQPDRSAVVISLSAGKTYQIAISGGANGQSGGSLHWRIELVNEPLSPAVETRTHFPFAFLPAEYGGGTALIDTIVPVGSFGKEEPYVQILDTRSGVWNTVAEVAGQTVDTGDVTVRPFLGAGSTLGRAKQ